MLRIHAAVQTHIFICNNRDSDMPNCTHIHTHTCTAHSNPLCSPNVQYSRIPSALRRWWRAKKNSNNKKWCGAVSHSLMTSPQSYAALIFPLLHVHHTHTQWDTHTEREKGTVLLIYVPCCFCCSSLHTQPGACTGKTQHFTSLIYTSQI